MNKNIFRASLAATAATVALSSIANGQVMARIDQNNWANSGGDAQRTNWQRISPNSAASRAISPAAVAGAKLDFSSPDEMSGFGLQLKAKLENTSRNLASTSGGATIADAGLGMELAVVGASGNRTIGIDVDTGYEYFITKHGGENPAGTLTCPGSSLATPARPATLVIDLPGFQAPPVDRSGQMGYWSQSYAPGVGISNGRTGTEPGPILTAQPAAAGRGGGAPAGPPGAATPAAPAGAAPAAPGGGRGGGAAPAAPGAPGGAAPGGAGRGGGPAQPINLPGAAIGAGQSANRGALPESTTGRPPVLYGALGAAERTNGAGPGGQSGGNSYAISNDGKLHILTPQYGLNVVQPFTFLPVGAQATDLIMVNNAVYTSTVNGCGGAPNGVWGVTTGNFLPRGPGGGESPSFAGGRGGGAAPTAPIPARGIVFKWETGGTASPSPVTFLPNGVAVVATGSGTGMGDSIVTLNTPAVTGATGQALSVKARFTAAGANFASAPIVLPSQAYLPAPGSEAAAGAAPGAGGRGGGAAPAPAPAAPAAAAPTGPTLIAAQARDGRIFILNEALTAPLLVTAPIAGMGGYKPAGLSSWVDDSGQRWLLTTTPTSVIAYKLNVTGNTATLSPGWTLNGLQNPLAPIIINGVVFAASSGEFIPAAGASPTLEQRITSSRPARLYAVNAITGARIWDSGTSITSFIPRNGGALWASLGQVLFTTYDNTLYAFGANMERHSNKTTRMAF